MEQLLEPELTRLVRPAALPRGFRQVLKHEVVLSIRVIELVSALLGASSEKIHKIKENVSS